MMKTRISLGPSAPHFQKAYHILQGASIPIAPLTPFKPRIVDEESDLSKVTQLVRGKD